MDSTRNNPPVAVRIVRPFQDEDALLAAEANIFTRTGVVLLGAPSRPNGVVLRFEMCLATGEVVMRGEGRVVGYRAATSEEESSLMLRFTRLDVKSKALLDRAVALREEKRSLAPPPSRPSPASAPPRKPPPVSRAPESTRGSSDDEAMDVNETDLRSADETDLTEQAPPVALKASAAGLGIPEKAPEKAPPPSPSPGDVPVPHPIAPPTPATPIQSPEPAPHPRAPEHMPPPERSPEPKRHAARAEFRPSLEPTQRDSALQRLRERKSRP